MRRPGNNGIRGRFVAKLSDELTGRGFKLLSFQPMLRGLLPGSEQRIKDGEAAGGAHVDGSNSRARNGIQCAG